MEISKEFLKELNDEQLSAIATKIGCSCIPGGKNRGLYIEKIESRYSEEFDKVIRWFESENKGILTDIKKYILDSSLQLDNKAKIEKVLLNWGIYNGYALEKTIANMIREKYIAEFIKEDYQSENNKKYPVYIQIVMFLYDLLTVSSEEIAKIIEKFIKDEIGNSIYKYLREEKFIEQYYFKKSIKIKVDEKRYNNLLLENNLLDLYKDYYKSAMDALGYSNYFDLISKIGKLQKKNNTWINNDTLKLIDLEYLKIMCDYELIEEDVIDDNRYISLTALGLSLFYNRIVEVWPGREYRVKEDNIFIAYNDNPKIILNNLLKNELVCKENLMEFKLNLHQ